MSSSIVIGCFLDAVARLDRAAAEPQSAVTTPPS